MSSLSSIEHTAIGAMAGVTEVTLMQPTVALKNALQEGRPLPRTPYALYRGYMVNAGAMLPITATQFGMNRFLEQRYRDIYGVMPQGSARIGVAMAAGSSSAVFGCAAEFVMIQQQKSGRPLLAELKHISSTYGIGSLYKGLSATIMRESLYTAGYLGLMPMLRARLEKVESVNAMPGGPLIVSGIVAGLLATVSTQPADTIKTRMQAFVDPVANPEYRSVVSTTKHIIRTEGVTTLFAGLLPRAFRIVCAVFILSGTRNTAIDVLENHRRRIRVVASDGETVQSDGALGLAEHADVERGSGSRDSFSRVSNP